MEIYYIRCDWLTNARLNLEKKFFPNRPSVATIEEWKEFHQDAKANKIAHLLCDVVPDFFYYKIMYPLHLLNTARYWIRYRTYDKYHVIDTGLKPRYYDTDTRMVHGLFQLVKDFVEVELAIQYNLFEKKKMKRDPEAGLKHLDWAISLGAESPTQSEHSKEIKEIYLWIVNVYEHRKDVYDEFFPHNFRKLTQKEKNDITNKIDEEEQRRYQEVSDILKRIIDVRGSMWT